MAQTFGRGERVYEFIKQYRHDKGYSPTYREIASGCGFSLATVNEYLNKLEAQGRVLHTPLKSRSLRLVDTTPEANDTADEVYQFVCEEIAGGVTPTQDEIADACFLSRAQVRRTLVWLEAQGKITRGKGQRNIRLVEGS